jgi:hypothetical protein
VERHHDEGMEDIDDPFVIEFHAHILIDLGKSNSKT